MSQGVCVASRSSKQILPEHPKEGRPADTRAEACVRLPASRTVRGRICVWPASVWAQKTETWTYWPPLPRVSATHLTFQKRRLDEVEPHKNTHRLSLATRQAGRRPGQPSEGRWSESPWGLRPPQAQEDQPRNEAKSTFCSQERDSGPKDQDLLLPQQEVP